MRRKLIKQDAFEQIANSSVNHAYYELKEAEQVLSRAIGEDYLQLHSFNEATVLYETTEDTFVHASYNIDKDKVTFSNIEELVIDESSKTAKRKDILNNMLECLLKGKNEQANAMFKDYIGMCSFNEAKKFIVKSKGDINKPDFEAEEVDDKWKKHQKGKLPDKESPLDKLNAKKKKDKKDKDESGSKGKVFGDAKKAFKKKLEAAGKAVKEAYAVSENVLDYVEYMKVGPVLAESVSERDESGNVVELSIPSSRARNEGKILSFDWKVLDTKLKVLRSNAKSITEDQKFVKAISDLKSQNAISDRHGLEDVLEHIAQNWPEVLYLTQVELAQIVGESLKIAGVNMFDDQTCDFMAEGILRKVHGAYDNKVKQVMQLASAKPCEDGDTYEYFQSVIENFYPYLDVRTTTENKVYADLYETLAEVWKVADRRGDTALKGETASYLNDLADVLNSKTRPDITLAEEAATWLQKFVEANVNLKGSTWDVSNMPHHTINGDHPDMAKYAKVPAIAGNNEGDWGDPAPMIGQDDMNYKGSKHPDEARFKSWGNVGKDTWPTLNNPYIPKPFGDYTMKGEKGVDKDTFGQHNGSWQSQDTWPNLQNPYIPSEDGDTGGQGFKMKNGPETDLVVDKGVQKPQKGSYPLDKSV